MQKLLLTIFISLLSSLSAKQVIVTGGAGLIGSNLCENLLEEGHTVTCIDNLSSGLLENIQKLQKYPRFFFIESDICLPLEIEGDVDEIYNLACPASPVHYQKDPIQTLRSSFTGIENLLKLAIQKKAKFLQTSTSEVYGDPLEHPQKESYWGNVNPNGIRACYDEGKRVAETLILAYHQMYDIDVKIVRIFNTYGPNMNGKDGRVVPNFIEQALRNENITVYGKGDQTRSFCYVSDLIEGLKKMMNSPSSYTGPVNLGNPNEMTVLELASLIIEMTESKSQISFNPLPQDDPKIRRPDITKAKQDLDWEPKISIKEGLFKTIQYFQQI